jgi:hypothetical protein
MVEGRLVRHVMVEGDPDGAPAVGVTGVDVEQVRPTGRSAGLDVQQVRPAERSPNIRGA